MNLEELARKVREIHHHNSPLTSFQPTRLDKVNIYVDENGCLVTLKDGTKVFNCDYNGKASVYRPGHWIKYVEQLYKDLDVERERKKIENFSPVDDGYLFGDFVPRF